MLRCPSIRAILNGCMVAECQSCEAVAAYVHCDALVDAKQWLKQKQVFIGLLIADMGQYIVVLLQHVHSRLQDWGEEVASGLDTTSIYEEGVAHQFLCAC